VQACKPGNLLPEGAGLQLSLSRQCIEEDADLHKRSWYARAGAQVVSVVDRAAASLNSSCVSRPVDLAALCLQVGLLFGQCFSWQARRVWTENGHSAASFARRVPASPFFCIPAPP
jgi:hypothetical protein